MTDDRPKPKAPLRELKGVEKHYYDEFSGAEFQREASLFLGSEVRDTARRRLRVLEEMRMLGDEGRPTDTVPGASNWVPLGPAGLPNGQAFNGSRVLVTGRITGIAIHPTTPLTMYVSGARGGVWKTTDGGATWTPKSDNEASLAIGALALAPSAPDTLYAGTGEGNIYYLVKFLPLNALNEVYQGSGLLKSTNGGNSWTLQGVAQFAGQAFYRIAVHPTNPDVAFAATTAGLFRTTDGSTWTQLTNGLPAISGTVLACTDVVIDPTTPDTVYTGFWGGGVYRCTNGTAATPSFSLVTGGPPATSGRIGLAISPSNPDFVCALVATSGGAYQGFYTSTAGSGGATWTSITLGGANPTITTSRVFVAVDISSPDVVYFCGTSVFKGVRNPMTGAWTSTDVGGPIHADHRTFATHPTDHLTVITGTDGGPYVSANAGMSWSDSINKGLCLLQLEFIDQDPNVDALVFGGTQDNGSDEFRASEVFYHADDGDGGMVAIDQSNPRNIVTEHFGISPDRSTQGAKFGSFSSVSAGITGNSLFYPPLALDPTNQNNIVFGGDRLSLDASQGTGGWPTTVTLPGITGSELVSALAYVNSSLIYAATSSGKVYRAVLSGASWTATEIDAAPLPTRWIWDIAVDPADSNTITVVDGGFGGAHVWRGVVNMAGTAAAWSDLSGTSPQRLPDIPYYAIAVDPAAAGTYYAGSDVGVWRTTDDGAHWTLFNEGLPNTAVYDLKLHAPTRLLRAGTHGRGVWERLLDVASTPDTNVYVRDHILHTGRFTAAYGLASPIENLTQHVALGDPVYWWQCTDVKIDAPQGSPPVYQFPIADVDYVVYESQLVHTDPERGRVNRVYVQVHNRGIADGDLTVKILYADATSGLPMLPNDFWTAFPGNSANITVWTPIGAAQTKTVGTTQPAVFEWDWTPPMSTAQHSCILVVADCAQDPIPAASKVFDPNVLVPGERHVGLKNLHVVDPTADVFEGLDFNPRTARDVFELVVARAGGAEIGVLFPAAIAEKVKGELKRRKLTAAEFKRLERQVGPKLAKQFEGASVLVAAAKGRGRTTLTGLPVRKQGFPGFLVLRGGSRRTPLRPLSVSIVQHVGKRVVGGNTFVVPARRTRPGDRRS